MVTAAVSSTLDSVLSGNWTLADLQAHLGDIPLHRIRGNPAPGLARVEDVSELRDKERRLYELIDGVLVEKTMGWYESRLAVLIAHFLETFLETNDLGIVLGADGALRILPGQVRIPDVCFISWEHFPARELPAEPVPNLYPDLAVEVLSEGNTPREMHRKLQDYFAAGTRLVWLIDPVTETAQAYTSVDRFDLVAKDQTLDGGDLLPGFKLPLEQLFARAGQRERQ
jgi:Uma2 family endonuclease